jgi:hypothetical protein
MPINLFLDTPAILGGDETPFIGGLAPSVPNFRFRCPEGPTYGKVGSKPEIQTDPLPKIRWLGLNNFNR